MSTNAVDVVDNVLLVTAVGCKTCKTLPAGGVAQVKLPEPSFCRNSLADAFDDGSVKAVKVPPVFYSWSTIIFDAMFYS